MATVKALSFDRNTRVSKLGRHVEANCVHARLKILGHQISLRDRLSPTAVLTPAGSVLGSPSPPGADAAHSTATAVSGAPPGCGRTLRE